jgi:hypothetical protein
MGDRLDGLWRVADLEWVGIGYAGDKGRLWGLDRRMSLLPLPPFSVPAHQADPAPSAIRMLSYSPSSTSAASPSSPAKHASRTFVTRPTTLTPLLSPITAPRLQQPLSSRLPNLEITLRLMSLRTTRNRQTLRRCSAHLTIGTRQTRRLEG